MRKSAMDSNAQIIHILVIMCACVATLQATSGSPAGYMILAPNTIHVGLEEKVSVTVSGVTQPVKVHAILQDYPNKRTNVSYSEEYFKSGIPGFLRIRVKPEDIPAYDGGYQQYLYLVAMCSTPELVFYKEVKIRLSFKDQLVLVQSDKPVYTPLQTVNIRIIPLDFGLKPSKDKVNVVVKNPQGVVSQNWKKLTSKTGFITKALFLDEYSLLGNWTVVTTYGYKDSQNTTIKFEVKEYVLPKFSVKIVGPNFILPSTKTIRIALLAKYTFGKPVKGDAMLRLTLIGRGFVDVKFYARSAQLADGKITFKVDTKLINDHVLIRKFPNGRRLRIDADIVERATGVRESAVDSSILFVSTPYHLSHEDTAKYFKPSLPFVVKIDVKYPNADACPNVPIQVTPVATNKNGAQVEVKGHSGKKIFLRDRTTAEGQAEFHIDVPRDVISITFQVETKDPRILAKENAAISFTTKAYNSESGSYLHIRPRKSRAVVGHVSMWDVLQNRNITSLSFMVMSRGRILAQATSHPTHGINIVSTMSFMVTMEMSPRCRVLAYYVTSNNEVVADSAILVVGKLFPNKVRWSQKRSKHETPGENFEVKVETTPWSSVGLLGVDESVYLLRNKYRLSKKKVFKEISSLDGGCGVGPGKDNREVFEKSGMLIVSNAELSTNHQSGQICLTRTSSRRRKRAIMTQEEKSCCQSGKFPGRGSCALRARFMVQASVACREAFLNCCRIEWNEKAPKVDIRQRQVSSRNAPITGDDEDNVFTQQIRKYFPETWIFSEETAGADGKLGLSFTLPDTITTWVVQAISISNNTGFGMTPPSRITTFKSFFVSLTVPYSIQRGEQLSVIASVFNYGRDGQFEVRLEGSHGFCSEAMPGIQSKPIKFKVSGNDAKSVAFAIVPVQLGKIQIRVSATKTYEDFHDSLTTDTVERELYVVPEGVERRFVQSFLLDPQGVLRDEKPSIINNSTPAPTLKSLKIVQDGHQIDTVMLRVPSKAIPGSLRASIYLTGNLIGPVVAHIIQGRLDSLLRMPLGCGEQNMIYLAPNVYVLEYLTNTKQVTADIESRAYEFIQKGYQQQLGFRRNDKSFSAFGETRPGSTWLTAFVIKVFCAAKRFDGVAVDENLVCDSISWLLSNQRQDGAFPEVHDVVHKSMLGGVHGDVSMTAYVLTALLECRCSNQTINGAIQKAVHYLEQEVLYLTKAHVLALATYSLALCKSPVAVKANHKLMSMSVFIKENNTRHWDVGGTALNVETAGYALLAQIYLGRLKHGGPIVKWLTEQRNAQGGFVSTQDTCVALQGLAKYSEKTAGANLDLSVSILPERDANFKRTFLITKKNALTLRSIDITSFLGGELFIDSLGTGVGQMQIELVYNVPSAKNETCLFDVKVNIKEVDNNIVDDMFVLGKSTRRGKREIRSKKRRRTKKCRGRNKKRCKNKSKRKGKKDRRRKKKKNNRKQNKRKNKQKKQPKTQGRAPDILFLNVCTRYLRPGKTGMTIMDIGIFTGFEADKKSLLELKKNVQPTVDKFEFSDRSIVLYISEVENAKEFCASFKVRRVFGVGSVQPVPVKVYDYYNPGESCTKFYAPNPKSELRLGICKGEQCRCTQDGCTPCNIDFRDVDDMLSKGCNHHEFVIRGTVVFVDEENSKDTSWLTYFIEIKHIFKQRGSKMHVQGIVSYKKRALCKCPELEETKDYLIMGQEQGAQLTLDKNTVVIPWQGKTQNEVYVLRAFRAKMKQGYSCP